MEINADFDQPVRVKTADLEWMPSPMKGVDRRMLDRIGGEVARATSIVRYAEGSAFPEHTHSGGDEFIVLEGVFQDEHGDYPAGTYVRNPVGTHHVPGSDPGCTIFVKLWQFDPEDQEQISIDMNSVQLAHDPTRIGVRSTVLAERSYEQVSVEQWDASIDCELSDPNGIELLVREGALSVDEAELGLHDWARWPAGETVRLISGRKGARIWVKRGHLNKVRAPQQA